MGKNTVAWNEDSAIDSTEEMAVFEVEKNEMESNSRSWRTVELMDISEEVIRLVLENFQLPLCGKDCLESSTGTICRSCFNACREDSAWRDSRALAELSRTSKRMHQLCQPYLERHRNGANALFTFVSSLYLPHGCIRRDLNLALRHSLKNGERVNMRTVSLPCRWNYLGRGRALGTLLHYAVEFDNVDAIEILVKHGADPSIPDSHSWTPLHLAAAKGKLECASALLRMGANPDLRGGFDEDNSRGWCPLHLAAVQADVEMIDLLLSHGGDAGKGAGRFGDTPLHEFACNGRDIACFPGTLRRTGNDVKQTYYRLVEATGKGPGGLSWANKQGVTPTYKANESMKWLFPPQSPSAVLSYRQRRPVSPAVDTSVYSEVS